ncbi:hypothetical protein BH11PSE4_BH11PSE4_12020 [soil metagenome]
MFGIVRTVVVVPLMSEDFIFSILLLVVGLVIIGIGGYAAFRQKLYYNKDDNSVATEIDIPIFGKLKTNGPAIALCFVGLIPVLFASNAMKSRSPNLVRFSGDIVIDPAVTDISTVTVGITSSLWSNTSTPDSGAPLKVDIAVPDSWPTYSAYAFAMGGTRTRPIIVGANRNDPKFKLKIAP